jgi:hypothetical protein
MSGVAAKLRVVHGGELKVVVHRGRHVEIDGPRAVAALGCWRRGHRHVRVLVAAQRLPGAEHAEAVGALVDDVSAASLGRRRRWQGRHAPALAFLHPGEVAAERLVRTEHLPARAALEPAARARGRRRAVVTVLAEQADVVVVLLRLRARFRGPALLVVLRSGPRPRVPRQHHRGHGHSLLRRRVRHAARRLGIRRRSPPRPLRSAPAHREPRAVAARGRLGVALAVLHDRGIAAGRPTAEEFRGDYLDELLGAVAYHWLLLRWLAVVHLGGRGRRQGDRWRVRCRGGGGHDVGAHMTAQGAAIVEPPEAELASVPVHHQETK